jgi:hypothetical protein
MHEATRRHGERERERERAGARFKCLAVHLAECSTGKPVLLYIS